MTNAISTLTLTFCLGFYFYLFSDVLLYLLDNPISNNTASLLVLLSDYAKSYSPQTWASLQCREEVGDAYP
jgi:hypothetical protein